MKITIRRYDIAIKAVEVLRKRGIRAKAIEFKHYSVIAIPQSDIMAHIKFL